MDDNGVCVFFYVYIYTCDSKGNTQRLNVGLENLLILEANSNARGPLNRIVRGGLSISCELSYVN